MAAAKPTAIFALDADTDGKYVLCPMEMARELMDAPEGASALKIRLNKEADIEELQTKIEQLLPEGVRVQSRAELAGSMYRVLDVEKMAVLLIGIMILVVASFSVVGTLTMIIIDKRDSIATLRALGADTAMIRSIFTRQGVSICMLGAVCGFVLGVALSLVQQHFGVIEIPAESFLIKAYPVKVVVSDLVVVVAAFSGVSLAMAYLTVRGRIKNENR
jgi:lipoprotein-releasing system permease protein